MTWRVLTLGTYGSHDNPHYPIRTTESYLLGYRGTHGREMSSRLSIRMAVLAAVLIVPHPVSTLSTGNLLNACQMVTDRGGSAKTNFFALYPLRPSFKPRRKLVKSELGGDASRNHGESIVPHFLEVSAAPVSLASSRIRRMDFPLRQFYRGFVREYPKTRGPH